MNKRILIVEDAEEIRASIAEILTEEGYQVVDAANGRHALDALDAAKELPGLILLDLMMPEMDGYEFRSEQQKNPRFKDIPVVLMTARGDIDPHLHELGAADCLRKP